ncbi:MAG: hypothetical protein JW729_01185 [Bacteroidales bacterium]|nr:hypothetical protein [Bacteroidales bacterium]
MIVPRSLVVSLIGNLVIVVSIFLPWISTTFSIPDIGSHTVSSSGVEDNLGQLVLLIGLASIGILFVKQKTFRVKFGLLLAVVNLFVIIYFQLRIMYLFYPYPIDMFQQDIQIGFYIAIIGSLTLIGGKLVEFMAKADKKIKLPEDSLIV